MTQSNGKLEAFIGYCILQYHKTRFEFQPSKKLKIGAITCTGEAVKGRLTIATGGELQTWLQVFLHETCHLDQRKERPAWFDKRDRLVTKLDAWLGCTPSAKEVAWSDICKILELEHDCEVRALAKIKEFGLPINLCEYSQKANAYLLSYQNTFRARKWDSAPYTKASRWKKMPKELLPLKHFTNI